MRPIIGYSKVVLHKNRVCIEAVGITLDSILRHLRLFIAYSVENEELLSVSSW